MQNSDHPDEIDKIVHEVDSENSAQGIRKYFRDMKGDRNRTRKRWIWELLQNACDASATFATLECEPEAITFRHDGRPFTMREAVHLIRHGSTKDEDDETRGQFGSGFITTHLLSPVINVSGQTDEGNSFKFRIERGVDDSVDEIRRKIDDACKDLSESLRANESGALDAFATVFRYPIEHDDVANHVAISEAVNDGIKMLRLCAPLVIAFNDGLKRINIKLSEEITSFEAGDSEMLQDGMQQTTVLESKNGERKKHVYILAFNERVSIAILTKPLNNGMACCNMSDLPKLFLDFPLVGTENFSFPAIVNSLEFDPEDNRDGVRLKETEAKSWDVLESACALLIDILKFSASRGWRNVCSLTNIPDIRGWGWLNPDRLREKLKLHLVEEVHDAPVVIPLDETGPISPKESVLPIAKEISVAESLWTLWDKLPTKRNKLPRQDEAVGWRNAVDSWGKICECEPSSFDGAADGCELASYIDGATRQGKERDQFAEISDLENLLKEGVCAIDWLNQMHEVIDKDGLREVVREYCIVLGQDGYLDRLSALHRDVGIADELKNVAELLEWNIRQELRDVRIDSLADEPGAGDWGDEYVVGQLIEKLRARGDANPDTHFAEASVGIFKWIADHEDWNRLIDFPAFAEKNRVDGKMHVIKMQRVQEEDGEYPYLAPVRTWVKDLQFYSDLFPESCVLADAFFDAVPDADVWKHLNGEGFAKNCITIKTTKTDLKPIPDDDIDGEHPPATGITVTDIAFLQKKDVGIMDRIRNNQRLARLFWRFLVDWLLKHEPDGLETKPAKCARCDGDHRYPLADWLEPVKENKWVPAEKCQERADAKSLGNLLRGKPEATPRNSEGADKLLLAIGVSNPDSLRFELADSEDRKTLIGLLDSGNLDIACEIAKDFENDPELPGYLADRRKQKQTAQENRELGEQVEELVREILEKEGGFKVDKIRVGADFEITPDSEIDDVTKFELASPSQIKWLVEVKSTRRGPDGVRMTLVQAREADNNKENYILCVVPLDGDEPEKEVVREKMRFVQNIGGLVAPLCDKFDRFNGQLNEIIGASENQGVQLTISSGEGRVLVKKSVWKEMGFPLSDLAERLKP